MSTPSPGRLRRVAEELEETGVPLGVTGGHEPATGGEQPAGGLRPINRDLLVEEVDRALRPVIHEGRVPSGGTFLDPGTDPATWPSTTQLQITREPVGDYPLAAARRFADGLSSWLVRRSDGASEWLLFDRPAGSERDLVVLSEALAATVVQRHPSGAVRIVGPFGVLRWTGFGWHHVAPVATWLDAMSTCSVPYDPVVLGALLEFAVHDLGANGVGALLIYRDAGVDVPWTEDRVEERLEVPPALRIGEPTHLGPLRHALAQVDGAAVFDPGGTLRRLGVRLVPSADAEAEVEGFKGMRHTSGRRFSYDEPQAIVIAVSEDGPVSVFRNGGVIGRSARGDDGGGGG